MSYYHAYEDRYKKIHSEGLLWFSSEPTPELLEWIKASDISIEDEICEIGCGEGRDALYLVTQGYKVTAVDASNSAIIKCRELSKEKNINANWIVSDALFMENSKQYKWMYSIATLHMLVLDSNRKQFLKSLYDMLQPNGKLLLVNMGDGLGERTSDISQAFELQKRNHMATGKKIMVASTTYRGVNWEKHKKELIEVGFIIEKTIITDNNEYGKCMTVYLTKL